MLLNRARSTALILVISAGVGCSPSPEISSGIEEQIANVEPVIPSTPNNGQDSGVTQPDQHTASEKFDSPWPIDASRKEQTGTALAKSFTFFEENSTLPLEYTLRFFSDPNIPYEYEESLSQAGITVLRAFSPYIQGDHSLFVGSSVSWLIDQAEISGTELPSSWDTGGLKQIPFEEWAPAAFPDGEPSGWAHKRMAWVGYSKLNTEQGLQYILSHELFHSIHLSLDGTQFFKVFPEGDDRNTSKWFVEGSASFFGWAVRSWADGRPYYTPTPKDGRYGLPICQRNFLGLESYESWYSSNAAYDFGQIAIEYIVASRGAGAVLEVSRYMGNGMSFADSFREAMGIELEEFYTLYNQHVAFDGPTNPICDS